MFCEIVKSSVSMNEKKFEKLVDCKLSVFLFMIVDVLIINFVVVLYVRVIWEVWFFVCWLKMSCYKCICLVGEMISCGCSSASMSIRLLFWILLMVSFVWFKSKLKIICYCIDSLCLNLIVCLMVSVRWCISCGDKFC